MVAVAQLVESRIVIPVVVGSSPISHPKFLVFRESGYYYLWDILLERVHFLNSPKRVPPGYGVTSCLA